ncbi:hypothetical protein OH76DRAFT_178074 [Lentinus brumalis]|uniref:Uncharacterized protein n=1 Tax=Lentinus brumalis TaxID=2498619 RepID=A0A371CNF5_9APHY|nr:hypothetical protein OH76DRAFT_178074 [Polyporus brumalis]
MILVDSPYPSSCNVMLLQPSISSKPRPSLTTAARGATACGRASGVRLRRLRHVWRTCPRSRSTKAWRPCSTSPVPTQTVLHAHLHIHICAAQPGSRADFRRMSRELEGIVPARRIGRRRVNDNIRKRAGACVRRVSEMAPGRGGRAVESRGRPGGGCDLDPEYADVVCGPGRLCLSAEERQ